MHCNQTLTYDGWHIPAGTTVSMDAYHVHINPDIFPDTHEFKPERFIGGEAYGGKAPEMDITNFVFGFGRRYVSSIC